MTVAPSTEYKSMKCNTNNIILIMTLTLKDPVTQLNSTNYLQERWLTTGKKLTALKVLTVLE